ncbi:MAG: phosphopantothenoylcysteine decarboxylase [Deltaproteobacteria bacterium]
MRRGLGGKTILITAGPTWAPIDDVRVVSNVSSGELGCRLARAAAREGMKTDVFLGAATYPFAARGVRVARFRYFDELARLIETGLRRRQYDVILHAAAVSDFLPERTRGKISSTAGSAVLRLRRAPKLAARLRALNPKALLVLFKLEAGVSDAVLLARARRAMAQTGADLVVANRFARGGYRGFILGCGRTPTVIPARARLTRALFLALKERLSQ